MAGLDWRRDGADWPHRAASAFVEAAGLSWHVQTMGRDNIRNGTLLLVHGTGAASHSWRGLMPILAQRFCVIAPDLPGHGFTAMPAPQRLSLPGMAADVARLLDALDVRPDMAVGHSAGAAILARMGLDRRIAPRWLVSLNGAFLPFGGAAGHLFSPLAKLLVASPLVPRLFAWQANSAGAVDRLLAQTGSQIDARGVALYRKLVSNPVHVAAALRMMANWQLEPLLRDLPKLPTPLLLIAASNDRSVPPDVSARVRDMVPGAVLQRVAGFGHLAHEEAPQLVADLILQRAAADAVQQSVK